MKRELKFRAWDEQAKMMLTMPLEVYFGLSRFFGFCSDYYDVMQFTGLKDKNGKDVYEGDVMTGGIAVCFENAGFCFENDQNSGTDKIHKDRILRLEIIGNIHENPELLK